MCTAAMKDMLPDSITGRDDAQAPTPNDVPLGDGLADAAKTSILSRRERIRRAVEGDGDPNEHINRRK